MSMRSPSRVRVSMVAIGLLLIPLFVAHIGVGAISSELRRLGPESVLILLPYAAGTAISAFPWTWLLDARVRPGAWGAIASRFAASGANALLPFFGVAGEPCRLLWLPTSVRTRGLATIVVDRLIYNLSGGLWLLVAAAAALRTRLPPALAWSMGGLGVLLLVGTFAVLLVLSRGRVVRRVERFLPRWVRQRYVAVGAELGAALDGLWRKPRHGLWLGFASHFVSRLVMSLEVHVALWSLNAPTSAADAVVLSAVPAVTSLVASSIPSQIGVQEGAQALASGALGFDPALGFSLVLLQRARQLAFVPLAPLLIAGARARLRDEAVGASAE